MPKVRKRVGWPPVEEVSPGDLVVFNTTSMIARNAMGNTQDYSAPEWCALVLPPQGSNWFLLDNKLVLHRESEILVDLLFSRINT